MLSGSTALAQLIGICVLPFVTRLYTPAEIGVVSLFLSFFAFWANTLSLRYEHAIVIAKDDAESHIVLRLAILLVIVMSLLGMPVLWLLQHLNVLEFGLLPSWAPLIAFPILAGHGAFMVYRSWALRGGLIRDITQSAVARASAAALTKLGLGFMGWGIVGLFFAELAGACISMFKLLQTTKRHFARSKPTNISLVHIRLVGQKYGKFPALETPSAWLDTLALFLPLPFVASLYGAEAAGWFGLARMVVSAPNSQIGAAVADVFQMELAKAVRENDTARARQLFYSLLKKMSLIGLLPLASVFFILPWAFPVVFGHRWEQAGPIAVSLAPWLYTALVISPLSRALSVLQAQEWKLTYDISALALLSGSYWLATTFGLTLFNFCWLISFAKVLGYLIYALVLFMLVESRLKGGKKMGGE